MRFVLALLFGLIAGHAQAETPEDRSAIQSVITQQLEAFKNNDAEAAYALAAPMIQQMFGNATNFLGMVAHGYPPVYRPRQTSFGTLGLEDDRLIQRVEIVGPDGRNWLALYTMEKQSDGSWKINGCQLTESQSVGA